jgi:hypothetical protein
MKLSFDDQESFSLREAAGSLRFNNPPSEPNSLDSEPTGSSIPRQERSEDTFFDDPPSDSNTLQRMPSQEMIENT